VLTRFYLEEESAEEICQTMGLSETQFRLIKSRAVWRGSANWGGGAWRAAGALAYDPNYQ
jgi:DNA-directed RNA polymerase specialized sigma24 family protein